jgi:hypothetical protein
MHSNQGDSNRQSLSITIPAPPKDRWAAIEKAFLRIAENYGASSWHAEKKESEWVLNLLFAKEEDARKANAAMYTRLLLNETSLAAHMKPLVVN